MARTKSTKAIDGKISELEDKLRKMKDRCNKISTELDALYEERKMIEAKELLDAIARSSKTRAEVLAFLEN